MNNSFDSLKEMKCKQHKDQVTNVIIDQSKPEIKVEFACRECLIVSNQPNIQILDFRQILSQINSHSQINSNSTSQSWREVHMKLHKKIEESINLVSSNIKKQLNTIKDNLTNLQKNLLEIYLREDIVYSINQNFNYQNEIKLQSDLKESTHNFKLKIHSILENFRNIQGYNELLETIEQLNCFDENQYKIGFNLIDQSQVQKESCYSISFNKTSDLMISGCEDHIRLWQFIRGKLSQIHNIKAHSSTVINLLFSKFENNFISGSYDGSLKCWNYQNQKQLECSVPYQFHTKEISCIIMNQKENLLFTGDMEKYIIVWKVNLRNRELEMQETLAQHKNRIFGLSLNESETILVSCSLDKQIIVWKKGIEKWEFQKNVNEYYQEFGIRIKFISDNRFVWVSGSKESENCLVDVHLDQTTIQKIDKKQLLTSNQHPDGCYFPIFYGYRNGQKALIVKHKSNIYLLKQYNDGILETVSLKGFQSYQIFGAVTNNYEFLVVWEEQAKKYMIYKIMI